jgi:hypothetical protein
VDMEDRVAPLAGLLRVAPAALRRMEEVMTAIDAALNGLEEETFVHMLPALRAAFTVLAPGEAESLGRALASHHGVTAGALAIYQPLSLSEGELQGNLAASQELLNVWREDGLDAWFPRESGA